MSREIWKPGTMLNPVPVVLVTSKYNGVENVFTVAWTGTICSDPAMTYISIRKERYSYDLIKNSKRFCINLVNEDLVYETDYCGVRSGKNENKFEKMKLEKENAKNFDCPIIKKSPVVIECELTNIIGLGSHDMFMAKILSVDIDKQYMDENGKFDMQKCNLVAYSHGEYYKLGEKIGKFGYSVKKQ